MVGAVANEAVVSFHSEEENHIEWCEDDDALGQSFDSMVNENTYAPLLQADSQFSTDSMLAQRPSSEWDGDQCIKVGVRIRPLLDRELKSPLATRNSPMPFRHRRSSSADARAWSVQHSDAADVICQKGARRVEGRSIFQFDSIFEEESSTRQVYDAMVRPILRGVASGRNGTVFAYGATGAGKTHTMQGDQVNNENAGIIQMVAQEFFDRIEEDSDVREYTIRVSFIEIYNEKVHDLLSHSVGGGRPTRSNSDKSLASLEVREDPKRGVYVNSQEIVVEDTEALLELLRDGNKNRACAATNLNEQSSRSHAIFRINVQSHEKENEEGNDGRVVRFSTLNLVDLAGSENGQRSGLTGQRHREGGKINQSLLSLSQVIHALSQPPNKRPAFINYRNSKLTRILQPFLSGNALMAVLCCITASRCSVEETRSTLKFAARAQLVRTTAKVNEVLDDSAIIKKLQQELAEATRALKELEERETTLESLILNEHPLEEGFLNTSGTSQSAVINVSTWTQTSVEDIVETPKKANTSAQTPERGTATPHTPIHELNLISTPESYISVAHSSDEQSEPPGVAVTPESSSDSRKHLEDVSSQQAPPFPRDLDLPKVEMHTQSPFRSRASHHLRHDHPKHPSEVVILNDKPATPLEVLMAEDGGGSRLYSELLDAEQRALFLQSKLDASEDLTENLFKDIESARRCIHQLVFNNTHLNRKVEKLRRKLDDQTQQAITLKVAIYLALFFFVFGRHEVFLATVMFLWLSLEVIT